MKHVGYIIKEAGRDPKYPSFHFNDLRQGDITDADREYGFTSEPVYTLTDDDREYLANPGWRTVFAFLIGMAICAGLTWVAS